MGVLVEKFIKRERRRLKFEKWWKNHCPHGSISSIPKLCLTLEDAMFFAHCNWCGLNEDIPNKVFPIKV